MFSTTVLRLFAVVGAVICLVGVALAVTLGIESASRAPASPWLLTATAIALIAGLVLTIGSAVTLARRPREDER
ncbi:hypothetical protein ITJ43_12285 [Microbacterium sp. VKM Ac-2870]|uniref:hypothetical protein n=1 Tax=Microbacterium sp. VKM Ac-2870 TaxID=2783825 RepID=UPI00188DAE66|nr:hypothetical protein [Microbacterium sp. VKM Ac-2870]MBF4562913.1 hypothetical protein [Microbacterium sp. VKM Ac-2870]